MNHLEISEKSILQYIQIFWLLLPSGVCHVLACNCGCVICYVRPVEVIAKGRRPVEKFIGARKWVAQRAVHSARPYLLLAATEVIEIFILVVKVQASRAVDWNHFLFYGPI